LPCYTMHKRGLCRCAVSVCLSVWVSVTFVYSVKTNKLVLKHFPLSGSHIILVFPPNVVTILCRGPPPPLTGALNARGVRKKSRFLTSNLSHFIACCHRCQRLGVINMMPPDRGKLPSCDSYRW